MKRRSFETIVGLIALQTWYRPTYVPVAVGVEVAGDAGVAPVGGFLALHERSGQLRAEHVHLFHLRRLIGLGLLRFYCC